MFKKLNKIIENAYAPYSNFKVAAIVIYEDGSEFYGVNVENISFGATICAERNAISNAILNNKKNSKISELHVLAKKVEKNGDQTNNDKKLFTPPCGICRQFISEFANNKTKIIEWNGNGEKKERDFKIYFENKFIRDLEK